MIRRLVEQSFYSTAAPSPAAVDFWLLELRSAELLRAVAGQYADAAVRCDRPAVETAIRGDLAAIESCLEAEQTAERAADQRYWDPLKKELEQLRLSRRQDAARQPDC